MMLFVFQVNFPLCTIAHTPRLPEHCIEYAKVLVWPQEHPFGGEVKCPKHSVTFTVVVPFFFYISSSHYHEKNSFKKPGGTNRLFVRGKLTEYTLM